MPATVQRHAFGMNSSCSEAVMTQSIVWHSKRPANGAGHRGYASGGKGGGAGNPVVHQPHHARWDCYDPPTCVPARGSAPSHKPAGAPSESEQLKKAHSALAAQQKTMLAQARRLRQAEESVHSLAAANNWKAACIVRLEQEVGALRAAGPAGGAGVAVVRACGFRSVDASQPQACEDDVDSLGLVRFLEDECATASRRAETLAVALNQARRKPRVREQAVQAAEYQISEAFAAQCDRENSSDSEASNELLCCSPQRASCRSHSASASASSRSCTASEGRRRTSSASTARSSRW